MAYTINKTNGGALVILNDGVVDQQATSLTLFGKNVSGFGDAQNENFVHLLENFANSAEPNAPIVGQIWYDTNTNLLRPMFYDGANWRPVAVSIYSNTSTDLLLNAGGIPVGATQAGDYWFNSSAKQLYVLTDSVGNKTLVGPEAVPGFNTTKLSSTRMIDSIGRVRAVIQLVLDGEVLGVISTATFTSTATNAVSGFPTVYRGLTFKNYSTENRYTTSTSDVIVRGLLDQLDSSYPRRNISEHIQADWYFDNENSLRFGTSGQSSITFNTASSLMNIVSNTSIRLRVGISAINFDGAAFAPTLSNTNLGSSSAPFNLVYAKRLDSGATDSTINGNWTLTTGSTIRSAGTNDIGTSAKPFQTVYTSQLSAGLSGTGLLDGTFKLTAGSTIAAQLDNTAEIGTTVERFATIHTLGISATTDTTPINVTGSPAVAGNVTPSIDNTYDLGSNSKRWAELHSEVAYVSEATINYLETLDSTITNLSVTSATFTTLVDHSGTIITAFDNDTTLAADSKNRSVTQHAVKFYADKIKNDLTTALGNLQTSLTNLLASARFVPAGAVFHVAQSTAPSGYLICDGSGYTTSTYADLFNAIGYTHGGGGGYFYVPDLRGQFIRGWDGPAPSGKDIGRAFGSTQTDSVKAHTHDYDDLYGLNDDSGPAVYDRNGNRVYKYSGWGDDGDNDSGNPAYFYSRTAATGDVETRPTNVALLPIIKT
jgi:hypothetical protein